MVGAHVISDRLDHVVVAVAPGDVATFTSDDPGHHVLLRCCTRTLLTECWRDLGADAIDPDPALRPDRHRDQRDPARGSTTRAPGPASLRVSRAQTPPRHRAR